MIDADHISFTDDGHAWWVVPGPNQAGGWMHLYDRPCDNCHGTGGDGGSYGHIYEFPCDMCDGTGRHTFTIEVETYDLRCHNCGASASLPLSRSCGNHNPQPIATTHRVSVVPGMALPIHGVDEEQCTDRWIEIHADFSTHRYWWDGICNAHTSEPIKLPPATAPGMWAVKLRAHQ